VLDGCAVNIDADDRLGEIGKECASIPLSTGAVQYSLLRCKARGKVIPVIVFKRKKGVGLIRNEPFARENKLIL
jgi:hypothetical protein